MKERISEVVFVLVFGLAVPWILCTMGVPDIRKNFRQEEIHITVTEKLQQRTVPVLTDNGREEMSLTDYVAGVVLGEMPGSFLFEAKKAQAVVARTYALRVIAGDRHGGAVCTDSGCCQSYRDPSSVTNLAALEAAMSAAQETEGMVLTYQGQLIDATYFSCSGGVTEAAVAVWGSDVPYLQSVESPGEEYASHYTDSVCFTLEEFQRVLGVELPDDTERWFSGITYTQGGGVAFMKIGGVLYQGTQLRKMLGLRSTAFEMSVQGNTVTITTMGFGHRVGMSQYGADAMAKAGDDFIKILHHYYQGVTLEKNWE